MFQSHFTSIFAIQFSDFVSLDYVDSNEVSYNGMDWNKERGCGELETDSIEELSSQNYLIGGKPSCSESGFLCTVVKDSIPIVLLPSSSCNSETGWYDRAISSLEKQERL